jgi:amidophosphoribosyltransferase
MGGFFGVASKGKCISELFYGTDYHCHLGTKRGGMATLNSDGSIARVIHDISNAQFKSKFDDDLKKFTGNIGIGIISDYDDQPLIISSHLGTYAIVMVGRINNAEELKQEAFNSRNAHFVEMSGKDINPTELVASLINRKDSFVEGIEYAQAKIDGSCSILLMTDDGIYAARDRVGRTPIILGEKDNSYAVTMETTAFPNLDYKIKSYLGAGEILLLTPEMVIQKRPPADSMKICAFLWVYYGYPSSSYENINSESVRYRNGEKLAAMDDEEIDSVAGVPDSGIGHAIGYSHAKQKPYTRPFVKYTPTWPRSFMPQNQAVRDLVAQMKLIPVQELIEDKRLLFCDDSIVRGTQLKDTVKRLFESKAKEVHMRSSCPPLLFGCRFLNFSLSRSELDLAGRRAIRTLEGEDDPEKVDYTEYLKFGSEKYLQMVDVICQELGLTTLKYQSLDNLLDAIGLPKEKICTYCWNRQG